MSGGWVAGSRPGSHTLVSRPSGSWFTRVVLLLGSTMRVGVPKAGSSVMVVLCPSALVTTICETGPPVAGVEGGRGSAEGVVAGAAGLLPHRRGDVEGGQGQGLGGQALAGGRTHGGRAVVEHLAAGQVVGRAGAGGAVGDDGLRRVGDEVGGGGTRVVGRGGGVTLVLDVGGLCVGVLEGGGGLGAPPRRGGRQPGAGAGGGGADVSGGEGVRDGQHVQQLPAGGLVSPRVVDGAG